MAGAKRTVSRKDLDAMAASFQAQIERRDREIERLKEENLLLLRTALKRSQESEDLKAIIDGLRESPPPDRKKKDL
ncbi:hypothetical protein JXB02_06395 [Candidatus Woesearchaeota archaeon]|nr:hypothetical protein [Candidatus Woesearchaeota archaeon]